MDARKDGAEISDNIIGVNGARHASEPREDLAVERAARRKKEHAVAVAEETISLLDGLAVSGHHLVVWGKAADEHQQRGLGKVEIRE